MDRSSSNLESIFTPIYIHQEEEPNVEELNKNTSDIVLDIEQIDSEIITASEKIQNLLETTKLKLANIKEYLSAEKERQEDMNIICNRYSEFAAVLTLKDEDYDGDLVLDNGVMSAKLKSTEKVGLSVVDVNGNGYEGNKYVYVDNSFLENTMSSNIRTSIVNGNLSTYYEYSRITVGNTIEGAPLLFNKDSTEAECSVELKAEKIGKLSVFLGAGRIRKEDKIDNQAGIVLNKKIGDNVQKDEILAYIYVNDERKINEAEEMLESIYKIG